MRLSFTPFLVAGLSVFAPLATAGEVAIAITQSGECGAGSSSWTELAGTVTGADPQRHSVVLYAVTNRGYVQPYVAQPYTAISKTGTWETGSHRGYNYWAIVVETAKFDPPATSASVPKGQYVLAQTKSVCLK